jgi:excisionase family DNA binding protein
MEKYTVEEYSKKFNVSRPTIYSRIKSNELNSVKEGNSRYILVNNDVKSSKNNINNDLTQFNSCEEYKKEIESLKNKLESKDSEIKELYNRIIDLEREQKDEIKKVNELKDTQLSQFMNLIKQQSENLLSVKNDLTSTHQKEEETIIEVDEVTPEYISLKDFRKLMKKKGYESTEKIMKLINKRFKKGDNRFIKIDGKVKIIKDKFEDL